MRKTAFCLAGLGAAFCLTSASAAEWQMDSSASNRLEFTASFEKAPVTGVFKDFEVRFGFDPLKPAGNHLDVIIRTSSADMANPDINQAIAGMEWFDFMRYRQAEFRASDIRRGPGEASYLARGTLSLKGVQQPLEFAFTWNPTDGKMVGELVTQRSIFGIGTGEWKGTDIVGDAVKVKFRIRLRPLP